MPDVSRSAGSSNQGPISHSVDRLRREFERWLEAALQQGSRALDAAGLRGGDRPWTPSVDLVETPSEVLVDVELPGVEPGTVDVSLLGNMLTIRVPAKPAAIPEGAERHLVERAHGPAQRSIAMPAPVLADSVVAEMANGVLRVKLQKTEKACAIKIPVR